MNRPVDKLVAHLLDAFGAAEELVERGRGRMTLTYLRLAGEALVGRIGDAAAEMRDVVPRNCRRKFPGTR